MGPRRGGKSYIRRWNFDCIYHTIGDINTSGLGGHIAISAYNHCFWDGHGRLSQVRSWKGARLTFFYVNVWRFFLLPGATVVLRNSETHAWCINTDSYQGNPKLDKTMIMTKNTFVTQQSADILMTLCVKYFSKYVWSIARFLLGSCDSCGRYASKTVVTCKIKHLQNICKKMFQCFILHVTTVLYSSIVYCTSWLAPYSFIYCRVLFPFPI